jgi:formamidopyrimidine-DNA glycosylase
VRKFGSVSVVVSLDEIAPDLGPEPLEDTFTAEILHRRLRRHGKSIKALLLDQAFVAGVGNIYADEALYRAKISPLRAANSLTETEAADLYEAIRAALTAGISQEGASVNWYRKPDGTRGEAQKHLYVYGREGEPCERCGQTIVKIRVAQRGTHYCPACQH